MKLKDLLQTLDEDDTVAIGASTSYLYFGSPRNVKEINAVSKGIYAKSKEYENNDRVALKNLPDKISEINSKIRDILKTYKAVALGSENADSKKKSFAGLDEEIMSLVNKIGAYERKRYRYAVKINEYQEYRKTFIPLLEREVVKSYRQEASDYAYIIIVEGNESSRFWTEKEYVNKTGEDSEDEDADEN